MTTILIIYALSVAMCFWFFWPDIRHGVEGVTKTTYGVSIAIFFIPMLNTLIAVILLFAILADARTYKLK